MFNEDSGVYWFSTLENVVDERLLKEYHLVGVVRSPLFPLPSLCFTFSRDFQLMGLAVYNSVILDIRFPLCCYKKLLSPPVCPRDRKSVV